MRQTHDTIELVWGERERKVKRTILVGQEQAAQKPDTPFGIAARDQPSVHTYLHSPCTSSYRSSSALSSLPPLKPLTSHRYSGNGHITDSSTDSDENGLK